MAYATVTDVQDRMTRTLSTSEQNVCGKLLDDAAAMIDVVGSSAGADVKKVVSCRMVVRAIGDGGSMMGVPIGASQGSMGGLGYTQSWTVGSGGSVGELYFSRQDKKMLGISNKIGAYSPVEEMACSEE